MANTYSMKTELHELARTAKQINDHIHDRIQQQNIDPDNVVVLIGEIHDRVSQHYLEKKLIQNLHTTTGLQTLFCEADINHQPRLDKDEADHPYVRTWNGMFNANSIYGQVNCAPMHYAIQNNVPVKFIDSPRYHMMDQTLAWQDRCIVKRDFPKAFQEKYQDNYLVSALFKAAPGLSGENIKEDEKYSLATSFEGKVTRDLHMLDNIVDVTTRNPGMSVAVIGGAHIADTKEPDRPTLSDMLLANGKDIVNVTLSFAPEAYSPSQRDLYHKHTKDSAYARERQYRRLGFCSDKLPVADINVEIRDVIHNKWSDFVHLHKINGDEIPLSMRIISTAKAILK